MRSIASSWLELWLLFSADREIEAWQFMKEIETQYDWEQVEKSDFLPIDALFAVSFSFFFNVFHLSIKRRSNARV